METKPFTGRLTAKRLVVLLNELFKKYEIEKYAVTRVTTAKFTSDQYEGGACKLRIHFANIDKIESGNVTINDEGVMLSFYFLKEIEDHLKSGFELCLKPNHRNRYQTNMLSDLEVDLKRIK